jgi:type IV pilus assembly protein PilC
MSDRYGYHCRAGNASAAKCGEKSHESPSSRFSSFVDSTFAAISLQQKMLIYRQLAQMLSVGIPLIRGLEIMKNQETHRRLVLMLATIHRMVTEGVSFSHACSTQPELFPAMYIPLLQTGETGGNLAVIINDIAQHAEEQLRVQRNVINSLTYPAAAIVTAAIVLMVIFFFCFPGFIEIFTSFHMKLPLITRIVITIYNLASSPLPMVSLVLLLIVMAFIWKRALARNLNLRVIVDKAKLYLPIMGGLYRKISLAAFCRAFVLLHKSGVSFLEIFRIIPPVMNNAYMEASMHSLHRGLLEGVSISSVFKSMSFAPPLLSQTMAVAEETGSLEALIPRVAEIFERDAEYTTEKILRLMEPVAIVTISGIVLVIILAIFLPLIQIMSAFESM